MILNYDEYINEGISSVNKEYTNKIYDLFTKNGYGHYEINLSNRRLPLMKLNVIFTEKKNIDDKFDGYFDDKNAHIENFYGFDYILTDAGMYFENVNKSLLKSKISHEIVHMQECYDRKLKEKLQSRELMSPIHGIINFTIRKMTGKDKIFDVFLDIIYKTTDNEIGAIMGNIYHFLKETNNIDKNFLRKKLKELTDYKKLDDIRNLDFEKLFYGLTNKIGVKKMCELINEFNLLYFEELKNKKTRNIKTYNFLKYKVFKHNILKYFLTWENIIKNKFDKFEDKLENTIENVIIDITKPEEPYTPHSFFENYDLSEKLKELLEE